MATVLSSVRMDDKVTSYISKNRKMLINGQWVEAASGKTFPTYNPATGEVLARVAEGDREDIDRAVKAARAAFETGPWSKMTPSERGRVIWKLGDLLEQNLEEFAELEMLDNGKPLKIARVADVPLAVDLFRYMAGWATKIEGNTIPISGKFLAYTLRQPVGVVGQIIPWNFPLLMAAWKLGPALATGCTVVIKPAEQTPPGGASGRRQNCLHWFNGSRQTDSSGRCRKPQEGFAGTGRQVAQCRLWRWRCRDGDRRLGQRHLL